MAKTPNYQFERAQRERQKANKKEAKAEEKRAMRERARLDAGGDPAPDSSNDET